jgi:hypothetical protein
VEFDPKLAEAIVPLNVTLVRLLQLANASLPIEVMFEGIVMLVGVLNVKFPKTN